MRTLLPASALIVLLAVSVGPARGQDGSGTTTDAPTAAEVAEPPKDVVKSFKGAEVKSHVYKLASKKMAGRASGTEGCDLAGEYIIEHVKEWGLEPAGENGTYKQTFNVTMMPFGGQGQSMNPTGGESPTFNVCAVVRGSDETLKNEYVVLTAHYDHVGRKSKRKYYFGADDNGSGTSALLQTARAFAEEDAPRPRRSILFIWCTAEERGLLGSKYWCNNPTVPFKDVVCDLNIDMVGRNDSKEMHVYGNASSPDLDSAHAKAAKISKFKFIAKTGSIFLRSDQVNFYEKNVPCLFWTSGLHSDYHATSDEAKRINTGKVSRAALHAYVTAWEIASRAARPRFVKMDPNASAGPLGAILDLVPKESLPKRVKLGDGEGAALVQRVMEDSAAEDAKLRAGDFIVSCGGRALPEGDPVGAVEEAMQRAKKKITLRFYRGSKKLKVTVKLDK